MLWPLENGCPLCYCIQNAKSVSSKHSVSNVQKVVFCPLTRLLIWEWYMLRSPSTRTWQSFDIEQMNIRCSSAHYTYMVILMPRHSFFFSSIAWICFTSVGLPFRSADWRGGWGTGYTEGNESCVPWCTANYLHTSSAEQQRQEAVVGSRSDIRKAVHNVLFCSDGLTSCDDVIAFDVRQPWHSTSTITSTHCYVITSSLVALGGPTTTVRAWTTLSSSTPGGDRSSCQTWSISCRLRDLVRGQYTVQADRALCGRGDCNWCRCTNVGSLWTWGSHVSHTAAKGK